MLSLQPSDHLSAAEIAAAKLANQGSVFNPQQQFPVTWPNHPVVAQAYVDQLARQNVLAASFIADLTTALRQAAPLVEAGKKDAPLAANLDALAKGLSTAGADAAATRRIAALRAGLEGISAQLR
ncbi:hypothetical protein D3C85_1427340 [compost metagenome]